LTRVWTGVLINKYICATDGNVIIWGYEKQGEEVQVATGYSEQIWGGVNLRSSQGSILRKKTISLRKASGKMELEWLWAGKGEGV